MDNPQKLATLGSQDEDKQNTTLYYCIILFIVSFTFIKSLCLLSSNVWFSGDKDKDKDEENNTII
jgi:hypothetical protein